MHNTVFSQKVYTFNWTEELFVVKEVKDTVPGTYVVGALNESIMKENCYKKTLKF